MRRHNLTRLALIISALSLLALPAAADPQAPPAPDPPAAPTVETPPASPPPVIPDVSPDVSGPRVVDKAFDVGLTAPLAGYQGSFFLRDRNDWFVLFPKGRLQIDGYFFPRRYDLPANGLNNESSDPRPRDTVFVRRGRAELQGTFARHFDWSIAGEFGSVPATGSYGTLTDMYVIVNYTPFAQIQVGQFDAPFTQENRTSDKYFDFMERSMAVRAFGEPANKEDGLMVFGWLPKNLAYYSLGVFNGDGQSFKNQDNWPAVLGRAFIAPLAPLAKGRRWMEELEVGGSFWWQHNSNLGLSNGVSASTTGAAQDDVAAMTTQGGVTFFGSNYNNAGVRSHLAPDGTTVKWALEAHLPFKRFGLKWEFVHQSLGLALYNDSATGRALSALGVKLDGYGTYVEAYYWLLGGREVLEAPGIEPHPRLNFVNPIKEPMWNLMVAAKWERVAFDVTGLPANDPAAGHYAIDAVELGVNAWCTKHVRLTANYIANFIGGFSHGDPTDAANTDAKNLRTSGAAGFFYKNGVLHELLFRAAIAL